MVANSSIISMMITMGLAAAAVLIPFLVIFLVARKNETGSFGSLGLGMLAFFWAHYLLPIPLIYIMGMFVNLEKLSESYYVVYVLIISLLFSVMACLGRLWCVWLMNKRTPSLYRAICSGVGFAAIQALSVIVTYFSYIKDSRVLNSGGKDALIKLLTNGASDSTNTTTFDSAKIDELISQLTQSNSFDIIMSGVNVLLITVVEIGIIVLMYEGFIRHKKWLTTAVCAGVNLAFSFITMILSSLSKDSMGKVLSPTVGSMIYNAFVLLCALASIWFTWGAIKRYKKVLKEGPYAHYAYFEKSDKDKAKDVL